MRQPITEKDLLLCIVLYEQKLDETATFKSLKAASAASNLLIDIFIYDNSKKAQAQHIIEEVSKNCGALHYLHDLMNPGVSKAYNKAAEFAADLKKKWLLIYDQDTFVQPNYFTELLNRINLNNDVQLFCPIANSSGKIISPNIFLAGRSFMKHSVKPGKKKLKYYSLINSGLAVNINAMHLTGGYDESFNLDFSDHYFVYKFKKKYQSFFVLNIINKQQLSSFEKNDAAKTYNRFIIYFRAAILFKQKTKYFLPVFWALVRALKLSVQYKTLSFIKMAFRITKKQDTGIVQNEL